MISDDVMIEEVMDEGVPWGAREAWWGVVFLLFGLVYFFNSGG